MWRCYLYLGKKMMYATATPANHGHTHYLVERFHEVAPLFLSDKSRCMVILPPEAKDAFNAWIKKQRSETVSLDSTNELYDGFATFGGYFAIRLRDNPQVIEDILTKIGVYELGQYIIVHKPEKGKPLFIGQTSTMRLAFK